MDVGRHGAGEVALSSTAGVSASRKRKRERAREREREGVEEQAPGPSLDF